MSTSPFKAGQRIRHNGPGRYHGCTGVVEHVTHGAPFVRYTDGVAGRDRYTKQYYEQWARSHLQILKDKGKEMTTDKLFVVINISHLSVSSCWSKEDGCAVTVTRLNGHAPTVAHNNRAKAEKEALRLSNEHGERFAVFETVAVACPPEQPQAKLVRV